MAKIAKRTTRRNKKAGTVERKVVRAKSLREGDVMIFKDPRGKEKERRVVSVLPGPTTRDGRVAKVTLPHLTIVDETTQRMHFAPGSKQLIERTY